MVFLFKIKNGYSLDFSKAGSNSSVKGPQYCSYQFDNHMQKTLAQAIAAMISKQQ